MKRCSRCRKRKSLDEFGSNKSKHDGRCDTCKPCKAAQVRDYYASNASYRQRTKERAAKLKRANKILIYQHLLQHPCGCGEKDVVVLDFDHREGVTKVADVSTLAHRAVKWQVIKDEIDKCDVRCANCHRRRTAKQFNGYALLEEAKRGLLIESDVADS